MMEFRYTGFRSDEVNAVLTALVDAFQRAAGPNLKGLYLHGSLAMGCFRPWSGDVDLLAVVRGPMERERKLALVRDVMRIAEGGEVFRPVEFSVVTAEEAARARHPISYILHYSSMWHERYKNGQAELVIAGGEDADLAAHFTVTRARGVALWGPPAPEVFGEVPREDYLRAVWYDIANSGEAVHKTPVYTVLNLCRTLMYLATGRVGSKLEGGLWAEGREDLAEYRPAIRAAAGEYAAGTPGEYDATMLSSLAAAILGSVRQQMPM